MQTPVTIDDQQLKNFIIADNWQALRELDINK
mgnify:CR=1 FL=1